MIDAAETPRKRALARLKQSREEVRLLLDPPPAPGMEGRAPPTRTDFPRSRTGLLIARPALALRLLRLIPASTVGKMLLARLITQLRGRQPS
jgi:hypothetical protein